MSLEPTLLPSRARLLAATWALATLLGACATTPAPPIADALAAERARVRAEQTEAAERAVSNGRLREALWRWRVVEAVADDPTSARQQIARVQGAIAQAAAAEEAKGEAAQSDHDMAAARADLEQALALDPDRVAPMHSLREAETAAVLKDISHEQGAAQTRRRHGPNERRSTPARAAQRPPQVRPSQIRPS